MVMQAPAVDDWPPQFDPEPCDRCGEPIPGDVLEGLLNQHDLSGGEVAVRYEGALSTIMGAVYCHCCAPDVQVCRECGCTDEEGCPEGCEWVDGEDICSSCADPESPTDEGDETL